MKNKSLNIELVVLKILALMFFVLLGALFYSSPLSIGPKK